MPADDMNFVLSYSNVYVCTHADRALLSATMTESGLLSGLCTICVLNANQEQVIHLIRDFINFRIHGQKLTALMKTSLSLILTRLILSIWSWTIFSNMLKPKIFSNLRPRRNSSFFKSFQLMEETMTIT